MPSTAGAGAGAGNGPERRAVLRAGAVAAVTAAGLGAADAEAADASQATVRGRATRTVRERSRKAPSGRWDTFNLSPARRKVRPVAVRTTTGQVERAQDLFGRHGAARTRLTGRGASLTLDFGKEVGGFVTLDLGEDSDPDQIVALTYAELSTHISASADDGSGGGDGPAVRYAVRPGGQLSTDTDTPVARRADTAAGPAAGQPRGGFRYLTVINDTDGTVVLTGVSLRITFAPDTADLRAYPNYFYCDDDLLNRVWYAGAYTVQTNIIASDQSRPWRRREAGPDGTAGAGGTVLVDGAKRDRTVRSGDLGISVLTDHVSLGDLSAVRNSLHTLYRHQRADGALLTADQAAGLTVCDVYHLWALVTTADYVRFSGDTGWLRGVYASYRKALGHITDKIGGDGLLDATAVSDRAGTGAGKSLEANALMYRVLVTAGPLAEQAGDARTVDVCARRAAGLKTAVESAGYWDESAGLYRDRPTGTALHPQGGNALAVWFGLTGGEARAETVSRSLAERWTAVGALTPEKSADAVQTFPGGMEVHAHFMAGRAGTALDLIRREWGYMLAAPHGTASTFWEGYRRDGKPDRQGWSMSAAHGWSTGPTSALTYHLLGISPVADGNAGYRVVPRPGGLRHAQGRLTTPSGVISASWRARPNGWFDLTVRSPEGIDEVGVPVPADGTAVVRQDGRRMWDTGSRTYGARHENGYVHLSGIPGGTHNVTVRRR